MPAHKYRPLKELASNTSTETLEDCPVPYSDAELMGLKGTPKSKAKSTSYTLILLLLLSLACNVALLAKLHHEQSLRESSSSFVGLERNFNMEITHDDRKIDDPVWDSPEYDAYLGWVAIDSKSAKQKGMPTSMHWPWDDHKSIYLLHGFHSLHCVYVLREAITEYRHGMNQTWPSGHVTHCLHTLREDTTCSADDTPRYTGRLHSQENLTIISSGLGQMRKCRDWKQLIEYAVDNSACYRRPTDHYVPLLDRYKNCPDGSTPWEDKDILKDHI